MEVNTTALLLAVGIIGVLLAFVLLLSSRKNKQAWQPTGPVEKHKISPIALVEEAHAWYASSKQDKDLQDALVHSSYGVACLRAIQSVVLLEEVTGATLPANVQGPVGLMAKLTAQQQSILNKIRSIQAKAVQPAVPRPMAAFPQAIPAVAVVGSGSGPPMYIPRTASK